MSDETPPKPKPGSLRDRIAQFEKQNAAAPAPAPPPPRPKPGNVQWKPKQPTPPSSPARSSTDAGSGTAPAVEKPRPGGMSAADAKESIGRGGSLKERMAVLQGRGAFGAPAGPTSPPIPPKPATEKPKWKPPPAPVALPEEEGEASASDAPERARSPPVEGEAEEPKADSEEAQPTAEGEEAQGEPDPEEEERQRRAALAARMARLGGARIGMAPPVPAYGKKPPAKKVEAPPPEAIVTTAKTPEVPKLEEVTALEESGPESVTTQSPSAADVSEASVSKSSLDEGYFKHSDSASSSLLSPDSASTASATSVKSPSSMPVPAGPRRAAPPRRKAAKSPSPAPQQIMDEPIKESPSETPAVETPGPETPAPEVEVKAEEPAELKQAVEEIPAESPAPVPEHEELDEQHVESKSAAVEESAPKEDLSALGASHDDTEIEDLPKETEDVKEAHVEEPETKELLRDDDHDVPVTSEPVDTEDASATEDAPVAQEEEPEEDEEARRKRVAERLAKMGGINPFAAPPPVPGGRPEPARKQSLGFAASQQLPASPALERRDSADSNVVPMPSPVERRPSVDSVGFGRRANASSRKSSVDVAGSPPPVPASPRPQRKASVGSVGVDVGESPPPVPTSPRPEIPQRRTSVGSIRSINEPRRRQSEDDRVRREISVSSQPPLQEEAQEDIEYTETEEPETLVDEPPAHAVEGHDHFTLPENPSSDVEEDTYQSLAGHEQTLHEPYNNAEEDTEPLSATVPIPIPPPSTRPPPIPSSATRPVVPQEDIVETPTATSVSRTESLRRSMPPPPRAPPTPPVDATSPERVVSPPPRRSIPPPPPPLEVEEDIEEEEESEVPAVIREDGADALVHHDVEEFEEQNETLPTPIHYVPPPNDARESQLSTSEVRDEQPASPPPPPIPRSTRPVSLMPEPAEKRVPPPLAIDVTQEDEIMDESDGDPIDPQFHSPQRSPGLPPIELVTGAQPNPSSGLSSSPAATSNTLPEEPPVAQPAENEEDPEQAHRRTIAERMAKLGGIRFGAPPPVRPPPPPMPRHEDTDTEEAPAEPVDAPVEEGKVEEEEEVEQARRQRIAARLANMGGMRFGMMPGVVPPPVSRPAREDSISPPPRRAAPPPRLPPPPEPKEAEAESDDGVQVEAEESELEEVTYEETVDDEPPPPPVPSRANRSTSVPPRPPSAGPTSPTAGGRPPVPAVPAKVSGRRSTADSSHSSREPSAINHPLPPPPSRPPVPPPQQSEYIIIDAEGEQETEVPHPIPPARPTRPPPSRTAPSVPPVPPAATAEPSDSMTSSQWELPSIPSGSLDFGISGDLSGSGFSDDSTTYPSSPPPPPPPAKAEAAPASQPHGSAKAAADANISPDELMTIWGKVGIQVCEVATTFFEKSKKSLVGDGTYSGFVHVVLSEVPNAAPPSHPTYGYLVYAQTGATVQKRVSDIMPGDILTAQDAKLKGHKGLQTYHQNVGADELLVGVVTEFEAKKSKVRVFQANQHVGQQTVESVSYRLDDLKSGTIKVYRVLEA